MTIVSSMRVTKRGEVGKGNSRALRLKGLVPGILYGEKQDNINLSVDPRDILKSLQQRSFYATIFEFDLEGKTERALCKAVQLHPVTDQPLHIDFLRVGVNTKINVNIPIEFINENECPGLKQGGVLNTILHSLEVVCSASAIPTGFQVDLKGLTIGTSIHIDTLNLPENVVATHPERDYTLATIVAPTVAKEPEPAAAS